MRLITTLFATAAFLAVIFSRDTFGLSNLVIISFLFALALFLTLFRNEISRFSFIVFFSCLLIIHMQFFLKQALTFWTSVALIFSVLGMVFSWGIKAIQKKPAEKNSKITDFIDKSAKLCKELPEDSFKEMIPIKKSALFASLKSKIYHEEGCSLGERITKRNRIYLEDENAAKRKGFKKHKCNVA